jgi:hypothetical protein
MAKIILNKEVLNKNQYQKVIDTSFTQLVQPTPVTPQQIPSISVAEFFNNYQEIFFQIPKLGDTNSHTYLIKTSQEYVGSSQVTDDTIQALIEEVTQLRQENFSLQQQLISGSL